jgi:hypothetical protein
VVVYDSGCMMHHYKYAKYWKKLKNKTIGIGLIELLKSIYAVLFRTESHL